MCAQADRSCGARSSRPACGTDCRGCSAHQASVVMIVIRPAVSLRSSVKPFPALGYSCESPGASRSCFSALAVTRPEGPARETTARLARDPAEELLPGRSPVDGLRGGDVVVRPDRDSDPVRRSDAAAWDDDAYVGRTVSVGAGRPVLRTGVLGGLASPECNQGEKAGREVLPLGLPSHEGQVPQEEGAPANRCGRYVSASPLD
jgi:hypothetical protein